MKPHGGILLCLALTLTVRVAAARPKKRHTEIDLFPVAGGTTDVGFGGGVLGAIAQEDPGYSPYVWRLAAGGLTMFKPGVHGSSGRLTYQDYYLKLTLPRLFGGAVRLDARASYTRQAPVHYYGIGNASVRRPSSAVPLNYYDYTRIHPTFWLRLRFALGGPWFIRLGNDYTESWYNIPPGSKLAQDAVSPDPVVRSLVNHPRNSAVDFLEYAFMYDTRNSEVEPTTGQYDKLQLRYSPGGSSFMPYRYGQANLTLRGYKTFASGHVTLAMRLVVDALFGHPPFYALARYDNTSAIGGSHGVRGVPAGRYAGKLKVFGNVEFRVPLTEFDMIGKRFRLGAAAFFDAGRVWAGYHSHPELDGTSLGLKYGIGGGLRLQQGDAFVVRFDAAWSPDARPIGLYLTAGEAF